MAFIRDSALWLAAGEQEWLLAAGEWGDGLRKVAVEIGWDPLLAAMAAGWALGLPERLQAAALAAFSASSV
jgi:hypothetical protein